MKRRAAPVPSLAPPAAWGAASHRPVSNVLGALIALFTFTVYLQTLGPTFQNDDSPETIEACFRLTLQHPPGYGLFTLMGHLFSFLPLATPAFRMNLFATLWAVLGVTLAFRLLHRLVPVEGKAGERWVPLGAAIASLTLAFSQPYWEQSHTAKGGVYLLQVCLFLGAILLAGKLLDQGKTGALGLGLGFALGAGAAHTWDWHFLLLLAFLPWFLPRLRPALRSPGFFLAHVGAGFLVGFSLLLNLPLRPWSAAEPRWIDPQNFSGFRQLVSRRAYWQDAPGRVLFLLPDWLRGRMDGWEWMAQAQTLLAMIRTAAGHWALSLGLLAWGPWLFALAGLRGSDRRRWFVCGALGAVAGTLAVVLTLPITQEGVWHLHKLMLPVSLWGALLLGFGAVRAFRTLGRNRWAPWVALAALGAPLWSLGSNDSRVDLRRELRFQDQAVDILRSLKRNSVFLVEVDEARFLLPYYQSVENLRPDLTFLPYPYGSPEGLGQVAPRTARDAGDDPRRNLGILWAAVKGRRPVQVFLVNNRFLESVLDPRRTAASGEIYSILRPRGWVWDWTGGAPEPPDGRRLLEGARDRGAGSRALLGNGPMDRVGDLDAMAWSNEGEFEASRGRGIAFDGCFQRALALARSPMVRADLWTRRGGLWGRMGREDLVLEGCRRAAALYPDPSALTTLSREDLRTGRFEAALDFARRAAYSKPSDARHWWNLGVAYEACGKPGEARRARRIAQRLEKSGETGGDFRPTP